MCTGRAAIASHSISAALRTPGHTARLMWTPALTCNRDYLKTTRMRSGTVPCRASEARRPSTAGLHGIRGSDPNRRHGLKALRLEPAPPIRLFRPLPLLGTSFPMRQSGPSVLCALPGLHHPASRFRILPFPAVAPRQQPKPAPGKSRSAPKAPKRPAPSCSQGPPQQPSAAPP